MIKSTTESYLYALERTANELTATLSSYVAVPLSKRFDLMLSSLLLESHTDDLEQYNAIKETVIPVNEQVLAAGSGSRFFVFHSNPTLNMSSMLISRWQDAGLPEDMSEGLRGIRWLTAGLWNVEYLVNVCPVFDYQDIRKSAGAVITMIPQKTVNNLLQSGSSPENPVFLYDGDGKLLSSAGLELSEEAMGQIERQRLGKAGSRTSDRRIMLDEEEYLEVTYPFRYKQAYIENWQLVCLVPVAALNRETFRILWVTILLIAACFLIALVIILRFTKRLNGRMQVLLSAMRNFHAGETGIRIERPSGDEIGQLYEGFDAMAEENARLIETIYTAKIQLQEAELERQKVKNEEIKAKLSALERQINPHYLFNTLESIRMHMVLSGDLQTADVIRKFASGYQEIMYRGNSMTTVRGELKFVKNFISVIQFRFPETVALQLRIEQRRLIAARLPGFLIQPLAENAVYHGIAGREEGGVVAINISENSGKLTVLVRDNGSGMTQEVLRRLKEDISSDSGGNRNLALKNIFSRLQLLYGDSFEFYLDSREGEYTEAGFQIPLDF